MRGAGSAAPCGSQVSPSMPPRLKYCVSTMTRKMSALRIAIVMPPRRDWTLLAAAIGST